MKNSFSRSAVYAIGSLSWAGSQWALIWLFARFGGGASAVGEYSMALAIATPLFIFGQFGLRTVYLSLPTEYSWLYYVRLRSLGVGVSTLGMLIVAVILPEVNPGLWVAIWIMKSADSVLDIWYGFLQRRNELQAVGIYNILNTIGTLVGATIVVLWTGSVIWAIVVSAGVSLLLLLGVTLRNDRSAYSREFSLTGGEYWRILRAGFPTTLSEGLAALSAYLPILYLSLVSDSDSIGIFAVSAYLLTFANLAGSVLKNIYITPFRHLLKNSGASSLKRKARSLSVLILLPFVATVPLVALTGGPILATVYGPAFVLRPLDLILLTTAIVPVCSSHIYGAALNALNRFTFQTVIWLGAIVAGASAACLLTAVTSMYPISVAFLTMGVMTWTRFTLGVFASR